MRVRYESNNSGGFWWLEDHDWEALERAGWTVEWLRDSPFYTTKLDVNGRFLGTLARSATIEVDDIETAIALFEESTNRNAGAIGCPCCGQPHWFEEDENEDEDEEVRS